MHSPNPETANLLNSLILNLDQISKIQDTSLASEEFALGVPLKVRPLDLCFGHAVVEPKTTGNAFAEIVIGEGLVRTSSNLPILSSASEYPFDPSTLLGSIPVQDAYAFGSIFLRSWTDNSNAIHHDLQMEMVRSSLGTGSALLIFRDDIDSNTALSWLHNGTMGNTTIPSAPSLSSNYATLELIRFVIDIDYYDPSDSSKNNFNFMTCDERLPRGWAGYAEENMASVLTPSLIRYNINANSSYTLLNAQIAVLVNAWVALPTWTPDFLTYWHNYGNMPTRLKQYLLTLGWVV